MCLEWLLLCGLLTWRQLFELDAKVFTLKEWQTTRHLNYKTWYTATCVIRTHSIGHAMHMLILRSLRSLLCVFHEHDDGRSYQMNNIFKQYQRKSRIALHSFLRLHFIWFRYDFAICFPFLSPSFFLRVLFFLSRFVFRLMKEEKNPDSSVARLAKLINHSAYHFSKA